MYTYILHVRKSGICVLVCVIFALCKNCGVYKGRTYRYMYTYILHVRKSETCGIYVYMYVRVGQGGMIVYM